jgi:hypothetical protein
MRAGWAYFVSFPQTAKDFEELVRTKLPMPVLTIGGAKALGTALGEQAKAVAVDATDVVLEDTGHWVMEERPKRRWTGSSSSCESSGSSSSLLTSVSTVASSGPPFLPKLIDLVFGTPLLAAGHQWDLEAALVRRHDERCASM